MNFKSTQNIVFWSFNEIKQESLGAPEMHLIAKVCV